MRDEQSQNEDRFSHNKAHLIGSPRDKTELDSESSDELYKQLNNMIDR